MHSVYRKTRVTIETPYYDPSPWIVICSTKLLCIDIAIYIIVAHTWRELSLSNFAQEPRMYNDIDLLRSNLICHHPDFSYESWLSVWPCLYRLPNYFGYITANNGILSLWRWKNRPSESAFALLAIESEVSGSLMPMSMVNLGRTMSKTPRYDMNLNIYRNIWTRKWNQFFDGAL